MNESASLSEPDARSELGLPAGGEVDEAALRERGGGEPELVDRLSVLVARQVHGGHSREDLVEDLAVVLVEQVQEVLDVGGQLDLGLARRNAESESEVDPVPPVQARGVPRDDLAAVLAQSGVALD